MGGLIYFIRDFVDVALAAHPVATGTTEPVVNNVMSQQLNEIIANYSIWSVYAAAISLGLLILIAIAIRHPSESAKRILFWSITGIITLTTVALVGMTIYLNQSSVSKGPVHWHADFQIWACGNQIDIEDPEGLSSTIGTPTLHEHNEGRIHVEGVVVDYADVNLGAFFRVIGGSLTSKSITVPTNEGNKTFTNNGPECSASHREVLQTFIYQVDEAKKTFSQSKIDDPQNFQFTQVSQVPPGDCVIFEFDTEKERTDKLCSSYEVAKERGDLVELVASEEDDGN